MIVNLKVSYAAEQNIVRKMFSIVAASASYLVCEVNTIKEDALKLDIEEYMPLDINE